jgi:hypothetical protein
VTRCWLALAFAALAGLAQAHEAGLDPPREAERQQRLGEARAALSRGEPDAALLPLEAAAAMAHAADTELLQLQAQLQRGEFRQALAFAAHTAAAHRDEPEARKLYLWLLALSGQPAYAASQADSDLAIALTRLDAPAPLPAGLPGPWPHGVAVPADARPVATGLLLDGGRLALVPGAALRGDGPLWLRNGLGRSSSARPITTEPALTELGLALLRVEPALSPTTALTRAPRPAFAGSPALRVAALRIDSAAPAWPLLQSGFLGRVDREGRQALGLPVGATVGGGPVFDATGRLIGLALPGLDGERLLPAASLALLQGLPESSDAQRSTPDEVYEAALPWVVQLVRQRAQ